MKFYMLIKFPSLREALADVLHHSNYSTLLSTVQKNGKKEN